MRLVLTTLKIRMHLALVAGLKIETIINYSSKLNQAKAPILIYIIFLDALCPRRPEEPLLFKKLNQA